MTAKNQDFHWQKDPWLIIVMFHGEIHDNIIMRKDKTKFVLRPGQNDLAKAQNFFLSFQMMRNVVH